MPRKSLKKASHELRPGCVRTKKAVAGALGIASQTIHHWVGLPVEDDGSYDIEKIREWRQGQRIKQRGLQLPSGKEIDESLKALEKAKAGFEKLFSFSREMVGTFRGNRAEILAAAQAADLRLQDAIRETFTDDVVKTLSPGEKAKLFQVLGVDFGILYDKERLELGQSTENVSLLVKHIKEIQQRKWKERGSVPATPSSGAELPAGGEPWAAY
jgi:hypothetical protein